MYLSLTLLESARHRCRQQANVHNQQSWLGMCAHQQDFFSPMIASADACSFFFFFLSLSAIFQFTIFMWLIKIRPWAGVRWCAQAFMGVYRCVKVCTSVHGYVWDEFSEYLLETRVLTSADFNMYHLQIFYTSFFWLFYAATQMDSALVLSVLTDQFC